MYLQTSEEHASSTLASIISPSCLEDDDGHGECPCGRAIDYLAAARQDRPSPIIGDAVKIIGHVYLHKMDTLL